MYTIVYFNQNLKLKLQICEKYSLSARYSFNDKHFYSNQVQKIQNKTCMKIQNTHETNNNYLSTHKSSNKLN